MKTRKETKPKDVHPWFPILGPPNVQSPFQIFKSLSGRLLLSSQIASNRPNPLPQPFLMDQTVFPDFSYRRVARRYNDNRRVARQVYKNRQNSRVNPMINWGYFGHFHIRRVSQSLLKCRRVARGPYNSCFLVLFISRFVLALPGARFVAFLYQMCMFVTCKQQFPELWRTSYKLLKI